MLEGETVKEIVDVREDDGEGVSVTDGDTVYDKVRVVEGVNVVDCVRESVGDVEGVNDGVMEFDMVMLDEHESEFVLVKVLL